jgi:hypothetical protein
VNDRVEAVQELSFTGKKTLNKVQTDYFSPMTSKDQKTLIAGWATIAMLEIVLAYLIFWY